MKYKALTINELNAERLTAKVPALLKHLQQVIYDITLESQNLPQDSSALVTLLVSDEWQPDPEVNSDREAIAYAVQLLNAADEDCLLLIQRYCEPVPALEAS